MGQCAHMDKNPCIVVVPVMSLAAMLSWDGEPCTAIVMVEGWERKDIEAKSVSQSLGMGVIGPHETATDTEANNDEIELARERMVDVLLGLARSLSLRTPEFRITHNLFNILGEITVPSPLGNQPVADRKVKFGLPGLHPAPDPLLLTVKSALVWSVRNDERLLAGGEKKETDDSSSSSIESEEVCVESVEQQPHWPMPRDHVARVKSKCADAASAVVFGRLVSH